MSKRRKKQKWLKWIIGSVLAIVAVLALAFSIFMYKVEYGFPFYEDEAPQIEFPDGQKHVLLFSKANGFVHSEAIEAGKKVIEELGQKNNWFVYTFDEGGVFNENQLKQFDLVIWNNVSGKVLTNDQRAAFQHYIENGGSFMGLHAAGDGSHHWDWYTQNLICAEFSHHPIEKHLQPNTMKLQTLGNDPIFEKLPGRIELNEEWYVFYANPAEKKAHILYEMDGELIDPNGNFLWMNNKEFGMGKAHPNIWYHEVKKGKAIYSAVGHDAATYQNQDYVKVLEQMVNWCLEKK
ncbi:ThuA domain-containing protein [Marinilongibacter aquaticus]|uniref:ThuA domain-containing protein n=1 Tax=Marinilongibacter aquaticus TaxID=2975157 RepID=UPI0021BD21CF|nr:ThuA domain-containing protein [Marinilongibacter aquaticus]UBM59955.1 ThuA domain-containing protein [Marinilongibacter aquaticus]